VARSANALDGVTIEDLHQVGNKKLDPFARRLDVWTTGVPWEAVRQYAAQVLGASFACALHRTGWEIESTPGELWMTRGGERINPFQTVNQLVSGDINPSEWSETIARLGIDGSMPLHTSGPR
jgi:hypothetical protein